MFARLAIVNKKNLVERSRMQVFRRMVNLTRMAPKKSVVSEQKKKIDESSIFLDEEGRIGLRIHAKPGAKKSCVVGIGETEIDISIGAPPREGAANEELISYLMGALSLRKNEVQFDKGAKSRSKIVLISTNKLTLEEVKKKLQDEIGN
ncbi:unnamed protein product [Caenorhabditis angaria]|uniref:Uncharacterized protein n=1 Tax=Caenorhabditis angaria TaxID=860376 RepID=A0A9P1I3Q6_9PELO|nr:unnamed protein product [Caenorhabditis angaria]